MRAEKVLLLIAGVSQVSNVYKMSSVARLYKEAVISDLRYCVSHRHHKADIYDLACAFDSTYLQPSNTPCFNVYSVFLTQ